MPRTAFPLLAALLLVLPAEAQDLSETLIRQESRQSELEETGAAADDPFEPHPKKKAYTEAVEAWRKGELELAGEKFAEALAEDPELISAHLGVALVAEQEGRHAGVLGAAKAGLEAQGDDRRHEVLLLGLLYEAAGTLGDAEARDLALDRLAEVDREPSTLSRLYADGGRALQAQESERAARRFRQVLVRSPDHLDAKKGLARALLQGGDHAAAAKVAADVLEAEPRDVSMLRVALEAAQGMGDEARSAELLATLTELDRGPMTTRMLYNQAAAAFNAGELEKAREGFEQVQAREPGLGATEKTLARIYLQQGDAERALELAEQALDRGGDERALLEICLQAHQALGNFSEARIVQMELELLDE